MDRNGQEMAAERPDLDKASVRDLIAQLAQTEDGLRQPQDGRQLPDAELARRAAAIVEELRHRGPTTGLHYATSGSRP